MPMFIPIGGIGPGPDCIMINPCGGIPIGLGGICCIGGGGGRVTGGAVGGGIGLDIGGGGAGTMLPDGGGRGAWEDPFGMAGPIFSFSSSGLR